jgi:hypothetical protein
LVRIARSSSSHRTTATCSSTSSSGGFRRSASSRPRTWPQLRSSGNPHPGRILRHRDATAMAGEGSPQDLVLGNNVLAHVPG